MVDELGCRQRPTQCPKAGTVSPFWTSVPRGTLYQGGDPCGFCLVPAIFFSAVSTPFHIAILAFGCVCCFSSSTFGPWRSIVLE